MSERPESGDQHDGGTAELQARPSESEPASAPHEHEPGAAAAEPGAATTTESAASEPAAATLASEPEASASEPEAARTEHEREKTAAFGSPTSGASTPGTSDAPGAGKAGKAGGATGPRLPSGISTGLLVSAVGSLITVLAAFLTWASVELTSLAGSLEGGGTKVKLGVEGSRLGKETLILGLAGLALIAVMRSPTSRVWGWIALLVTGLLVVALASLDLVRISDPSDLRELLGAIPGCSQAVQCTGERTVGLGVYLTILGGVVIMVGALLHHGVLDRLRKRRSAPAAQPTATPTA